MTMKTPPIIISSPRLPTSLVPVLVVAQSYKVERTRLDLK